ncbi:MAG: class I SAM-dependent methyltransferase [Candidatus Zipacnadales bacterium]
MWAKRLGVRVVSRGRRSILRLCQEEDVAGALVLSRNRPPTYVSAEGDFRYYYHPGMALTRIRNIERGLGDPMIVAMELDSGDRVLDCTLGRAADAVVASYVVGETGRVVGIESSPLLAELTRHGLQTYQPSSQHLTCYFRAITVRQGDHLDILRASADEEYDVVFFDPLFEEPIEASEAMQSLRQLADRRPLTEEALAEARRVAARCVVIKERTNSAFWKRLPLRRLVAGRSSSVAYGVLARTEV